MRLISTVTLLALVSILGFTGCDLEDDPADEILGKWVLVHEQVTEVYDGQTDTFSESYEIFDAIILEFFKSTFSAYENDLCSATYDSDDGGSWVIEGDDTIILSSSYTYDGTTYTDEEEMEFTLNGDDLTLIMSETDGSDTYTARLEFERYSGSFPPAAWSSGLADDAYEPDDNPATAGAIAVGASAQEHSLQILDDDWLSFNGDAGTTYIIETTGDMDTELYLYESNGTTQITYNDDGGDEYNARISWTCLVAGTYTIMVQAFFSEDECGYYDITLTIGTGTTSSQVPAVKKLKKAVSPKPFWRR